MAWPLLADLAVYLQQDLTKVTDQVNQALQVAIGAVEAHCLQPLLSSRDTVTLSLNGSGDPILLPRFPVTALVAVTVDGLTTPLDRFYLNRPAGILEVSDGWWGYGRHEVVVTFDAGYVTIPQEVRWIVLRVASRIIQNPTQVTDESYQGYSNSYGNSSPRILTDDERRTLDRFRAPAMVA